MGGISDLICWREAASLVAGVTELTRSFRGPGAMQAADQLCRAVESITSNIAEGYGRGVRPEGLQYLRYAKASADEVESQLRTAILTRRASSERVEPLIDQARRVQFLIRRYAESVTRRINAKEPHSPH